MEKWKSNSLKLVRPHPRKETDKGAIKMVRFICTVGDCFPSRKKFRMISLKWKKLFWTAISRQKQRRLFQTKAHKKSLSAKSMTLCYPGIFQHQQRIKNGKML
jgi:hypothetical protein